LGFREVSESASVDEFEGLTGGDGGEGPAGSTLSLVFDMLDSPFGYPVNVADVFGIIDGLFNLTSWFVSEIDGGKFFFG
jgi:hypothetical protein